MALQDHDATKNEAPQEFSEAFQHHRAKYPTLHPKLSTRANRSTRQTG